MKQNMANLVLKVLTATQLNKKERTEADHTQYIVFQKTSNKRGGGDKLPSLQVCYNYSQSRNRELTL